MPSKSGVLRDKVVLVTGAGRGLGAAYAKLAAAEGALVVLNDIDDGPVYAVAETIRAAGGQATVHVADVSDWDEAGGAVERAIDVYGQLDGLINNAGVYNMHRPHQQGGDSFRRMIEVNVLSVAYCGIHSLRHMTERNSGSIVNVTSGAHAGMAGLAAYGASKGAVASLTYGWAIDLQQTKIRVNAISPLAQSRMLGESDDFRDAPPAERGDLWRRSPAPENNAPAVIYLLSDLAADVHGQIVRVENEALSIMSHPLVALPIVWCGATSIEAVREAFATTLKPLLQPLGLHRASIELAQD